MLSKKILLTTVAMSLCVLSVTASDAFKIKRSSLVSHQQLGNARLYHDSEGFHVMNNGTRTNVEKQFVDPKLRDISQDNLAKYLTVAKLGVTKVGENEYAVRSFVPGKGGGPVAGTIAYWIAKSLCYGTAVAGTGVVVVASGGMAGAVTGGLVAASTLTAGTATTVVGGAIAGAGLASEAALLTTGVVSSAGGLAGAVAAVETGSSFIGAIFAAMPFLP